MQQVQEKHQTTQPTSGEAVTADSSCCENCVEPPRPQQWGSDLPFFWACRPCGPAGWLALLLTKAGDVENNPGPITLNKKVWICEICHKQIHVRKKISIRCNRIEHWVHLRCAGIRQAQYTDTWTCHLHRQSRLTPHTDITPPHGFQRLQPARGGTAQRKIFLLANRSCCCYRPTPPACSCGGVRQPNFSREALPGVSST